MTNDGSSAEVLAERLSHLFETVNPPYTAGEVAEVINVRAGAEIMSAVHLSQWQAGQGSDPSHSQLLAIARFFEVDIGYLGYDGADWYPLRRQFDTEYRF